MIFFSGNQWWSWLLCVSGNIGSSGFFSVCSFTKDGSECSLWGKVVAVLSVVSMLAIFAVIDGCCGCNGLLLPCRWLHLRRLC